MAKLDLFMNVLPEWEVGHLHKNMFDMSDGVTVLLN